MDRGPTPGREPRRYNITRSPGRTRTRRHCSGCRGSAPRTPVGRRPSRAWPHAAVRLARHGGGARGRGARARGTGHGPPGPGLPGTVLTGVGAPLLGGRDPAPPGPEPHAVSRPASPARTTRRSSLPWCPAAGADVRAPAGVAARPAVAARSGFPARAGFLVRSGDRAGMTLQARWRTGDRDGALVVPIGRGPVHPGSRPRSRANADVPGETPTGPSFRRKARCRAGERVRQDQEHARVRPQPMKDSPGGQHRTGPLTGMAAARPHAVLVPWRRVPSVGAARDTDPAPARAGCPGRRGAGLGLERSRSWTYGQYRRPADRHRAEPVHDAGTHVSRDGDRGGGRAESGGIRGPTGSPGRPALRPAGTSERIHGRPGLHPRPGAGHDRPGRPVPGRVRAPGLVGKVHHGRGGPGRRPFSEYVGQAVSRRRAGNHRCARPRTPGRPPPPGPASRTRWSG